MSRAILYDADGQAVQVGESVIAQPRLQQGFGLAKTAAAGVPSLNDPYRSYSDSVVQQDQIWDALFTEAGIRQVGAQMAVPIRTELDYQGHSRKFLEIDVLAQGQIARYDKDINVPAYLIAKRGGVSQWLVEGEYVEPTTWEIMSPADVRLSEIQKRRFNILDRVQEKIRIATNLQEDDQFLLLSNTIAVNNTTNNPITTSTTGADKVFYNELTSVVADYDLPVYALFMRFDSFKDIRSWGINELDPVSMREILQTGFYGSIWGIDIIVARRVPKGVVFCYTEPRFLGVLPVRTEFIVMPNDKPSEASIGFIGYEEIGQAVVNANGVAKGVHS